MTEEPDNKSNDEWVSGINSELVTLQQTITSIFQSFKRVGDPEKKEYDHYDGARKFIRRVERSGGPHNVRVWDEVFELQSKYGMVRGDAIGQTAEGLYKNTDTQYRLYDGKNTEQYLLDLSLQLEKVVETVNSSRDKDRYDIALLNFAIGQTSALERRVLKYHVKEPSVLLLPHIPAQMPAPIKVGIINDKLEIINATAMTGEISPASFERLRTSVSVNLRSAITIVERSNIDGRFLDILEDMLTNLTVSQNDFSPEALGMNFELYLSVLSLYTQEIPDIAIKRFESLNHYVPILLNQFEDWRKFKALSLPALKQEEIEILIKVASTVKNEFNETDAAQVINYTIGNRIGMMTTPVLRGYVSAESIVNPLLASISNVFAGLCDAAISYIPANVAHLPSNAVLTIIPTLGVVAIGFLRKHAIELAKIPGFRFPLRVLEYITDIFKHGKL